MRSIVKDSQFIKTVILPALLGAGLMTLAVMLWTSTAGSMSINDFEQQVQADGKAFVVIMEGDRTLVRPFEEVLDELLQTIPSAPDTAAMAAVLRSTRPDGIPYGGMIGIEL